MLYKTLIFIFFIFSLLFTTSCKKDKFLSTSNLSFSTDTLIFDTVFTTIGSTTKQFKIYNTDKKGLKIEEIQLMGGSSSPFRINVDGLKGTYQSDLDLESNDSLFIFVEVTLSVNNQNLPLVVEDSIRFRTNGKDQYINLVVWGQDAYFHYNEIISPSSGTETWLNDKPHVIYNYAAVDSAKTLNINAGTHIYLHKNSSLFVYKSTLNVNGDLDNEVIFEGDRLESYYKDISGQWYGIYFNEARSSSINYAIIRNGTAGIHTYSKDANNTDYTLTIRNTKIFNHASYGVFSYYGSSIKMENSIIAKCVRNAYFLLVGGDFNINHCHILGYGESKEQNIAFAIKNNFVIDNQLNIGQINEGRIYNSVIYGFEDDEFAIDTLNPENQLTFNFDFKNNLIKKLTSSTHSMFTDIIWNTNPNFKNIDKFDFTFDNTSILNDNGTNTSLDIDILKSNRDNTPDIGAYEIE